LEIALIPGKTMTVSPALAPPADQTQFTTFARRSFLPLRHDALWLIESGVVRTLSVLEDGNYSTQGLWGTGDVIGRVFSSTGNYQIECLTPVKVTLLPKHRWHEATEALICIFNGLES
jgi:CRP-like cAMP-binding protein